MPVPPMDRKASGGWYERDRTRVFLPGPRAPTPSVNSVLHHCTETSTLPANACRVPAGATKLDVGPSPGACGQSSRGETPGRTGQSLGEGSHVGSPGGLL